MNWLLTSLMATLLAASAILVHADDSKKKDGNRGSEKRKDELRGIESDEREGKGKELRRTNGAPSRSESEKRREYLKNMTPEERAAKRKEIKERLEKRIGELRARQTNATLSAQETRELERREQILKRFEQEMFAAPRIERPKPVFTNSPVEK